jgi:endonuclease/exonuclease/phosphatase family metal-dependent hydrolase
MVKAGGLLVSSIYLRHAAHEQRQQFLKEVQREHDLLGPRLKWVIAGDWNCNSEENPLAASMKNAIVATPSRPTRTTGSTAIDYFVAHAEVGIRCTDVTTETKSDHCIVWAETERPG